MESILTVLQNAIVGWHTSLKDVFDLKNVFEVLIIVSILMLVYQKFIKNSQSEKFVKGAFVLVFIWILSEILIAIDLPIIGAFLRSVVLFVSLSLIVIFQPELRKLLGYLGQVGFINKLLSGSKNAKAGKTVDVIKEVIEAVKYLSKTHTGALMVFQKDLSNTFKDVGTILNADVSTELILTIFHVNTPLHDGAIVINGDKIISAGVLLPLTEDPKLSWKYGTRHRAAIGMTENTDAACLVVSEETGDVSITMDGALKKYDDIPTLKSDLENILGLKKSEDETAGTMFSLEKLITKKQKNEK